MAIALLEPGRAAEVVPHDGGIGPGRFVMVVGPSGAGKDSLIAAAREGLAGDEHYVFPRRWITRPASSSENNVEVTPAAFETHREAGRFAASWTAHGLGYGLPVALDEAIEEGRTVICNVSRTIAPELRARYANTLTIEVTAPAETLAARLAARRRPEDGPLGERLSRRIPPDMDLRPEVVIVNGGEFAPAVKAFIDALT